MYQRPQSAVGRSPGIGSIGSSQVIRVILTILRGEYTRKADEDRSHTLYSVSRCIDLFESVVEGEQALRTNRVSISPEHRKKFLSYRHFDDLWGDEAVNRATAVAEALKRWQKSPDARLFDSDETRLDVLKSLESLERQAEFRLYELP